MPKRSRDPSPPPSPPSALPPPSESQLFDALFRGDTAARAFCKAIDVIGSGQPPSVEDATALADASAYGALASAVGVERGGGAQASYVLSDQTSLAAFNTRKNAARAAFHAALEERLERHLDALIHGTEAANPAVMAAPSAAGLLEHPAGDHAAAQVAIADVALRHGLVAAALLQGVRAALHRQAASGTRVVWCLPRANLINGGEVFASDVVRLLRTLGLEPIEAAAMSDALEGGAVQPDETHWSLRQRLWSRSRLRGLANCVRADAGIAPAGKVDASSEEPFEHRAEEPGLLTWCAVL